MPRQFHYNPQAQAQVVAAPGPGQVLPDDRLSSIGRMADGIQKAAAAIVPKLGQAYVREQTGRVDDMLLDVEQRFAKWQTEYRKTRKGSLGVNAGEEFAAEYARLSNEAIEAQDASGHEVFGDLLKRRLEERAMFAAKDGMAWAARQEEVWQKSVTKAQEDDFMRQVSANPSDYGRIEMEKSALKGSLAARNPGLNLGAEFNRIDEATAMAQAESFLAAKDTQGLRKFLSTLPRGSGKGPVPGSKSERALAGWNYGFVTDTSGKFATYATREDGLLAIADRFRRYHYDKARHANTLADVMAIYAPPNENNTHAYVQQMAKWMGVDPHAPLDFDDRETIASFVRSIPMYEHGQFVKITPEQAFAAADAALAGQKPRQTGTVAESGRGYGGALSELGHGPLAPKQIAALEAKADALERERSAGAAQAMRTAIDNYVAASLDGHVLPMPFAEDEIAQAFGDKAPNIWAKLKGAQALGQDLSGCRVMTDAQLDTLLSQRKPNPASESYAQDASYYDSLSRAVHAMRKKRADDPAAWVCGTSANLEEARKAMLTSLTPETAAAYLGEAKAALASQGYAGASLLTRSDASAFAAWLSRSDNPAASAARLAQSLGHDFQKVLNQITPELSPHVACMAGGMAEEPGRLIMEAMNDKDFEKTNLALLKDDVERAELEDLVRERVGDVSSSFMGGANAQTPAAINTMIRRLSLQYIRLLHLPLDKAVDRAFDEVVGSRYEVARTDYAERSVFSFGKEERPKVRIPKSQDTEAVLDGMKLLLASPPIQEMHREYLPGIDRGADEQAMQAYVKQNGYWLTDADEQGAVLFIGANAARDEQGRPYRKTWAEFAEAAAANKRGIDLTTAIQEE